MVQKVLGWSSESALYWNPTNLDISKYVLFFPAQPRKKAPSGFESFVLFAQIDGILNYRMHAVITWACLFQNLFLKANVYYKGCLS